VKLVPSAVRGAGTASSTPLLLTIVIGSTVLNPLIGIEPPDDPSVA
jgi:hypothetical protein